MARGDLPFNRLELNLQPGTTDQNLELQENALRAAGCEIIRSEKRSGNTTAGRDELQTVLDFLRKGDVLMARASTDWRGSA